MIARLLRMSLLMLSLAAGSAVAQSVPSVYADVAVSMHGGKSSLRVLAKADYGERRLQTRRLSVIREATLGKVTLRWLRSEAADGKQPAEAMAVPDITPAAKDAGELFWDPATWAVRELEQTLDRELPPLTAEIILVPKGFRVRHVSRWPIDSNGITLRLAIGSPPVGQDSADFDVLWVAQTLFVHELLHVLASHDSGYGLPTANLVSEEARAYAFDTCSTLMGEGMRQALVSSPAPLETGWARRFHHLSSDQMFRTYAASVDLSARNLEPTHRGGILAGIALWELLGDERFVLSELSRNRVAVYCDRLLDYQGDWLVERPCAADHSLAGVCAVHARQ